LNSIFGSQSSGIGSGLLIRVSLHSNSIGIGIAMKLVPASFNRGAGIQAFSLDSRQKHAGMTYRNDGVFILWSCTRDERALGPC
jgi:hypothetical protein